MDLLNRIKNNAKQYNKKIVLPESTEERTIIAADELIKEGIAQIILIGNPEEIKNKAKELNLSNIDKAIIIDPKNHNKKDHNHNKNFRIRNYICYTCYILNKTRKRKDHKTNYNRD